METTNNVSKKKADYTFKILMLGNSGAGKTSLLVRLSQDTFNPGYITTIGIDIVKTQICLSEKNINLKIWDTAGQERYRTFTQQYYQNTDGIVLVLDLMSQESYTKMGEWMKLITSNIENSNISVVIAANKCDVSEEMREVDSKEIEEFAKENNVEFIETSAKSGMNVKKCFHKLAQRILKSKGINVDVRESVFLREDKEKTKKKKFWC